MVFSDDEEIARFARIFRNQGEDPSVKYFHPLVGQNYRMSDVHAAIGLAQFRRLDSFLRKRAEIAAAYTEAFVKEDHVQLQHVPAGAVHSWFFYPLLVQHREKVTHLSTSIHTPGMTFEPPLPI